jgi:hypothetical protein
MSNNRSYNPYGYIGIDLAAIQYNAGDKVRITEPFDDNFGMIGKIIRYDQDDDSYLIEFEFDGPFGNGTTTDWYYGTNEFVHADKPSNHFNLPPPVPNAGYCRHEWREDSFFTKAVYKTCKKCGARYEDV